MPCTALAYMSVTMYLVKAEDAVKWAEGELKKIYEA